MSFWESRAAIEAFPGQDIEKAVFYPDDERFLIERDLVRRTTTKLQIRSRCAGYRGGPARPVRAGSQAGTICGRSGRSPAHSGGA